MNECLLDVDRPMLPRIDLRVCSAWRFYGGRSGQSDAAERCGEKSCCRDLQPSLEKFYTTTKMLMT